MIKVFLGLGSNVGNRIDNIAQVIEFFSNDFRFYDLRTSSLYETMPYGNVKQDNFINAAISFFTSMNLEELFALTKDLESKIGRVTRETWGPREIDIDLLLFGDLVLKNDFITIPHKGLLNRDFVIEPLVEIDNEVIHPENKKMIKLFLSDLEDKYIIDKIKFNLSEIN